MALCRRCGRTLKAQPWVQMGIGRICAQKEDLDGKKLLNDSDQDQIEPYNGGTIKVHRVPCQTMGANGQLSMEIHMASGIKTNVQRTIYRHSPSGFNFGYGGSGPADLALNILRMFTSPDAADKVYQHFKFQFLAQEAGNAFVSEDGHRLEIPRHEIETWLLDQGCPLTNKTLNPENVLDHA